MTVSRLPEQDLPHAGTEGGIDLGTLAGGLRRHLPLILLVSALVALAVYLTLRAQPPVYEASASIIVSSSQSQIGVVGGSVVSPLPRATVAQVVQSPLILQPLIRAVQNQAAITPTERQRLVRSLTQEVLDGSESTQDARSSVIALTSEQDSGDNNVYTLRARAHTPEAAQILADLASQQLLAWDAGRTARDVRLAQHNFELQLAQVDRRLALPGLTAQERLTLTYRRATLQDNLAQLGFLESARAGVLKPLVGAVRPLRPVTLSPLRGALLAGLLTLFLGLGAAALRTALDRTVRGEDDLFALGLPTLAALPRLRSAGKAFAGALPAARKRGLYEALGFLRVNLHAALGKREHAVLMLAGVAAREGTSTVTAALAHGLAQGGQRVLLIDGDLWRGTQQHLWEQGSGERAWEQLCGVGGARTLQEALRQPDNVQVMRVSPHLHLLPAGPGVQDSLGLLGRPGLGRVLRCWGERYDLVLVDSPPLLALADGIVLGQQADAVLVVAQAGRTRLSHVRQAVRQARAAGLPLLGFVLNRVAGSPRVYGSSPRPKEVR